MSESKRPMTDAEVLTVLKQIETLYQSIRWDMKNGHQHDAFMFMQTSGGFEECLSQGICQLEPDDNGDGDEWGRQPDPDPGRERFGSDY